MIFSIFFWIIAWIIAGAPPVEPWNTWFAFLIACSVATLAAAIGHRGIQPIPVPVPVPVPDDLADDEVDD